MAASTEFYKSSRLAYGYAHHRPPVHPRIIEKLRVHLGITEKLNRALDIGCGAGLSTAALVPLANEVIGIEPMIEMLAHRKAVTTTAQFVVAKAERLPFADQSFDLITAAGALNYAELGQFFPEAKRVLKTNGVLVIYDFSEGLRLLNDQRLEAWYTTFKQRYPAPSGYALEVQTLDYSRYGLRLDSYEEFKVGVPMTHENYLLYALSETSIELAISYGVLENEIRQWCDKSLREIFGEASHEVFFDAYIANVIKPEDKR
jgi:ubiquinone/menaquinone biosynthesis C-methylase UbiE